LSKRRRRVREKQLRHALSEGVRPRTIAAGSGLAVAATLVSGSVAMAASNLEVDTTADDGSLTACTAADDDCSLRGAITRANADAGSTITFASSVTGTINLTSDLPTIGAGQTITGPGAEALVIEDGSNNGLYVDTNAGDVTISGLSILGSKYAGVRSSGTGLFTLSQAMVLGNGEQGVFAESPLAITDSTLSGNGKYGGGCVCSSGTQFGVYAVAGLTMKNSTVTGTGSIFTKYGGGVFLAHGGTIENSTIAGNGPQTGVGIVSDGAYTLELDSSIVSGNTGSGTDGDVVITNGGSLAEYFSLIENDSGLPTPTAGSGHNLNGEDPQLGQADDNGGPTLTIKQDPDSPVVDTGKDFVGSGQDQRGFALVDAPAIDNAADGRDMGAVELQAPTVTSVAPDHADAGDTITITGKDLSGATGVKFGTVDATDVQATSDTEVTATVPAGSGTVDVTVTTPIGTSDVNTGDTFTYGGYVVDTKSDDGSLSACTTADDDCSLRGAITASNSNYGREIDFTPAVQGYLTPATPLPTVSGGQTIAGPGADVLGIDAAALPTGLAVDTGHGVVDITELGIAHGVTGISSSGGNPLELGKVSVTGAVEAVHTDSQAQISQSAFSGNQSGITATGSFVMDDSTVYGNDGTGLTLTQGGSVNNSTIAQNNRGISVGSGYSLSLMSTIVADNATQDVTASSSDVSESYSLVENTSGLPALQPGSDHNLNGQDPKLGLIGKHGGPTQTTLPATDSPIIDQGSDPTNPHEDQREVATYDNPAVANADDGRDIGAVELAPPAVTSVAPAAGAEGQTVTITGTNFTGATGVKFGSASATGVHVVDATHVTAVVPAGSGTVDVTVVGQDGTSAVSAGDKFHYTASPSVSSLSPDHGSAGDTVTIMGSNLGGATAVKFGATDATSFSVVDATHVRAVVPAGTGTVDVTVTNPDCTSATSAADSFRYVTPPTVSSLSPGHGHAGDTVTIAGTNLAGVTGVNFGSVAATGVHAVDSTHVTAVAPAGSGTVDVRVTTPDGTSPTGAADAFTYDADVTPPPPPKPPKHHKHHLTDPQVLALMRRPVFSDHFVTKPMTLVFRDRLPEKGTARYHLVLLKDKPDRRADRRTVLGRLAAKPVKGAKRVTVTIHLGARGWRILSRNPTGQLVIHTAFKRKYNGHVIRCSRPIEPDNRPGT
jgi:IPT/TIG domain